MYRKDGNRKKSWLDSWNIKSLCTVCGFGGQARLFGFVISMIVLYFLSAFLAINKSSVSQSHPWSNFDTQAINVEPCSLFKNFHQPHYTIVIISTL